MHHQGSAIGLISAWVTTEDVASAEVVVEVGTLTLVVEVADVSASSPNYSPSSTSVTIFSSISSKAYSASSTSDSTFVAASSAVFPLDSA